MRHLLTSGAAARSAPCPASDAQRGTAMSIHHFDHPEATDVSRTGGKGANLALMTQAGFQVPPGFVVSAQSYREFFDGAALKETITELIAGLNFEDPDE